MKICMLVWVCSGAEPLFWTLAALGKGKANQITW